MIFATGRIHEYDLTRQSFLDGSAELVGSRPLAVAQVSANELYYGEYCRNAERRPVSIFGSVDGGRTWRESWRFDHIRHVHGVFHDPYDNALWVTTGDNDDESGIYRTDDRFASLEPVLRGSQQARAVHLLFTPRHIYFGSDTPREQNFLYRFRRRDNAVERLQPVESSVFFAAQAGEWLLFSTAHEPSEVNPSPYASIWGSTDGSAWLELVRRRKDIWPAPAFQHGQFRFPYGRLSKDNCWASALAVNGDGTSWRLPLADASTARLPSCA